MSSWTCPPQIFPTFFYDGEVAILYPTMNFWATLVLVIILAIGPHFLYRGVMGFFFPLDKDIVREAVRTLFALFPPPLPPRFSTDIYLIFLRVAVGLR